jgi:hypothetical protein
MVDTAGAVSTPALEMDPAVVDHNTDVLLVPVTVAENCLVLPDATLVLTGFTLTLMLVGVDGGFTVTVAEALASTLALKPSEQSTSRCSKLCPPWLTR